MATQRRRNRQAVSQTREDRLDFKKNRSAGDSIMTARAMASSNTKRGGPTGTSQYAGQINGGDAYKEKTVKMPKRGAETSTEKDNAKLRKRYPANEEALKATLAEKNAEYAQKEYEKLKRARGQSELKHDAYVKGKRT